MRVRRRSSSAKGRSTEISIEPFPAYIFTAPAVRPDINGRIDAANDDITVIEEWLATEEGACCKIVGTITPVGETPLPRTGEVIASEKTPDRPGTSRSGCAPAAVPVTAAVLAPDGGVVDPPPAAVAPSAADGRHAITDTSANETAVLVTAAEMAIGGTPKSRVTPRPRTGGR